AVQGNGGNIQITTQGIFGLEFRPQLTPENDITASSQFGLSGTVTLETPNVDPSSGTIELPADLTDASNQVAAECDTGEDSRFVATGRGGVPPTPEDPISNSIWTDLRDLSDFMDQPATTTPNLALPSPDQPIIEAVGWVINAEGQVELVAISGEGNPAPAYATCAVSDHT
ncbi:MAG: S-layer family protein, partial [Leptolyngbyaceae bacterium]|nr:S-layer family protein [Leptolyngbyaceae bacterium]